MNAAETAAPGDDPVRKAIRPALLLAWILLGSLLAYLAIEEFIRARFSPFLGFVRLGNRLSVRYAFFLAAPRPSSSSASSTRPACGGGRPLRRRPSWAA